jgi:hypothetical protein
MKRVTVEKGTGNSRFVGWAELTKPNNRLGGDSLRDQRPFRLRRLKLSPPKQVSSAQPTVLDQVF